MAVRTVPCPGDLFCYAEDCTARASVAVVDDSRHNSTHEELRMTTSFGVCAVCWGGVAACERHAALVVSQLQAQLITNERNPNA